MRILKTFGESASSTAKAIEQLEQRGAVNTAKVDATVRTILADVRGGGDKALREYAARFDGLAPEPPLLVSREEMQAAWEETTEELHAAMRLAQANIRAFAEKQLPRAWSFRPQEGMEVGQIVRPLESVGCYVPGGRYPLPSTLLMTVTPAQVAGVERIVVCSPKPARETLAAALSRGRHGVLPHRRSAGRRGHGLRQRTKNDCASGEDRRARQSVCHGGEDRGIL